MRSTPSEPKDPDSSLKPAKADYSTRPVSVGFSRHPSLSTGHLSRAALATRSLPNVLAALHRIR
jgi:hypothetical protein